MSGERARLILLNGAPGSGKSTLAGLFVAAHPMALALDIDTVRGMVGGWLDRPLEAGAAARELALAMARTHLLAGHDVVVPQYLGRLDLVIRLDALAADVGVPFVEVALVSDPEDAVARFVHRSLDPRTPEQRDASALLDRSGGTAELHGMYRRLLDVIAARPATRTVRTVDGQVEQTYADLLAAIDGAGDGVTD